MKLKVLLFLSVAIVIFSVVYIFNLINRDFVLNKEDEHEDTMSIWITTPGLLTSIHRFERDHKIKVNIKQFANEEMLLEELALTNMEGNLPDLIEIHSSFGLDDVVEIGQPFTMEEIGENLPPMFHEATLENFSYEGELYGYPLGVELPIIVVNRSILDNHLSDSHYLSPFSTDEALATYKDIQDKINSNNKAKPFWLFHFDEDIPYYWTAFQQIKKSSNSTFENYWIDLIKEFELVPPLDNHMAITRFSNMEVGALITTSSNLQMIQELIGSTFEFEVFPLFEDGQPLLVSGNGFISFSKEKKIALFYESLGHSDVQLEFLSNTGWMPATKSLLESESLTLQLPMAKYLGNLVKHQDVFSGRGVTEGSRERWENIKGKAKAIERNID